DLPVTVTAAGRPAAAVDVWLVPTHRETTAAVAHATTDADGRVNFGKDLIGRLWDDGQYPQLIALDRDGRFGAVRLIYPTLVPPPLAVKLAEVGEVRGRVVD